MADHATPIATLFDRLEDYGKTTIELIQLQAIDKSADLVSTLVTRLAIITTVASSVLIINIGLALWIGALLGQSYYGFFVVGGFYALVAILLHVFSENWIKYPISNSMIKQLQRKKVI